MSILVINVDDKEANRYVRSHALRQAGFDVLEAANGRQAIELVVQHVPAALLLDVRLPDIDGFAVAREIRRRPAFSDLPVVFISAAERSIEAQTGALEEGADAYLIEPVHPDVVVSTIRVALRHRELERQLRDSNNRLQQEVEARRAAEEQLKVALNAAEMGTWKLDIAEQRVHASDAADALFGCEHKPDGQPLDAYLNRIHPEDTAGREALSGRLHAADFRVILADGSVRWLLYRGKRDLSGAHILGAVADITARRQAEEQVRFQARLLDAVGEAVIATDPAGRISYWSASAESLYGWTSTEAVGRNILELTVAEISRDQAAELMTRLGAGESWRGEFQVRRKNGATFWAQVTDTPVRDSTGALIGVIGLSSDVSQRRALEEELRRREERFRLLAENSMDLISRIDERGAPEYLSPSYEQAFGYSRPELMAMLAENPMSLVHGDDLPAVQAAWARLADQGEARLQYRLRRKDGTYFWTELVARRIVSATDGRTTYQTVCRDVTERVLIEHELQLAVAEHRRYHRMLEALMDCIPEGITIADAPEGTIRWVSRHGRELTGRPPEQIEGLPVDSHAAEWGLLWADGETPAGDEDLPLTRAIRKGEVVTDEEWVLQRPDGRKLWLLCNAGPIRDEGGNITGGLIAWRDISERRATSAALAESEARLKLAMEAARLGLWEYDPTNRVVRVSERASEICGALERETTVEEFVSRIHPSDRERLLAEVRAAIEEDRMHDAEYRLNRQGETAWVRATGMPLCLPSGDTKLVGILEDISERKNYEQALRTSQERLQLSQTAGGVGTWDADLVTNKVIWSEGMYPLWGQATDAGELTIEQGFERIHESDRERLKSAVEMAISGGRRYADEFRVVMPDGSVRWLAGKATVYFDDAERPVRMIGVNYDITARKVAEDALLRSNDELQQFAYAISHDLQEPLRTITSFTELLSRRAGDRLDTDAKDFLGIVSTAAARMRQMIESLLTYSRLMHRSVDTMAPVDLGGVFDWAVSNLRSAIEECGATVTRGPLPVIAGDFGRMAQLFQNLIGNGLKYRRPGIDPELRIYCVSSDVEQVICVEDNGLGIPAEYAAQVFQPFRRLHGPSVSGTGLGLAICKRIVEQHGGRIWLEQPSHEGTKVCFTVLPDASRKAASGS